MSKVKPEYLKIIIWDADGVYRKMWELRALAEKVRADVMLINGAADADIIQNYAFYRNFYIDEHGRRTVIYVKSCLDHQPITLPQLSNLEANGVAIHLFDGSTVHLFAAHHSFKKRLVPEDLKKLMDSSNPVIIAGNLHSKHTSWNSGGINFRGQTLFKFIEKAKALVIAPDPPIFDDGIHLPDIFNIAILKDVSLEYSIEAVNELSSKHYPLILHLGNRKNELPSYIYELIREKRRAKKEYQRTLGKKHKKILNRLTEQLRYELREFRSSIDKSDV